MRPIKTPLCNFTFTAPASAEPGSVGDLHCHRGDGFTMSWWQPSNEERAALAMGAIVQFQVMGHGHPVVSLGVTAPQSEAFKMPEMDLLQAVATSCARTIETSGIPAASVPFVIATLMKGLSAVTRVPVRTIARKCRDAAEQMTAGR